MRALPIGVPKIMVSTLASADTSPYVGSSDIDDDAVNRGRRGFEPNQPHLFAKAAAAICGMVNDQEEIPLQADERPLIAASMFGNTTRAVNHARSLLEARLRGAGVSATGAGGEPWSGSSAKVTSRACSI